ncbi:hypothetical protein [Aquirhabdus parva]|uniref:Uncharacterized protein n=1 Tax=Aquirhabdus parva TaxID=2283318 RepID=A0A345P8C0_9GAMM|nr:hypothetical protein [Aquirhabdus parva]AXI03529.1 hypothetical protein HYN46_12190 [Aquirhabdus parva]
MMISTNYKYAYLAELTGSLLVYFITLAASLTLGERVSGISQTLIYITPMLPVLLIIWAIVRQFRRSDELLRKTILEHIAIATAITVGWTFTYGFLENAGYPKLSMFMVWPVMGVLWAILAIFDRRYHQ